MKSTLLLLVFSSSVFAAVQKTEICDLGKISKKVELVGEEAKPCSINYQGEEKWKFSKEIAKCESTFDKFVEHLEKKGFTCKAEEAKATE